MALAVVVVARVRICMLCPTRSLRWDIPSPLLRARALALGLILTLALTMAWLARGLVQAPTQLCDLAA